MRRLAASRAGLSEAEAAARRARHGENVLPERRVRSVLAIYLAQFRSAFIYLLLAAAAVSVALGEIADAVFIFVVLQLNAAIGTVQEASAETRARALQRLVASWVTAIRDGVARRLDARALVPGDIVQVESGLKVPADIRLLAAGELRVDESLLTGESVAVAKHADAAVAPDAPLGDRATMLHAGTAVVSGRGTGVVTATGAATELGRIAARIATEVPPPPPLLRQMETFTHVVTAAVIVVLIVLGGIEAARGAPLVEVFLLAVALAVSAIPEGLPVAMTVALSISVSRMARRNVLVRLLPAVEGLGACTLIASDKTGTLTLNQMSVRALWLCGAGRRDVDDPGGAALLRAAASTNEAQIGPAGASGDPVDAAFLLLASARGVDIGALRSELVATIPYEPERKYAAAFGGAAGVTLAMVKGAPETVLAMCAPVDAADAAAAEQLAREGYRVIAVAQGHVAARTAEALSGLSLVGFAGLIDPPRPEAADAIARARRAGVDVRMVTGDHPLTARAIARDLGLAGDGDAVATGQQLATATDAELAAIVRRAKVFARIEPLQKLRIVELLRAQGHVVAVTGDGINDAAALHAADIGVAMGKGGTDVAREAADIILVDDNFASIVAGIEEGRIAYDNVRKVIHLVISTGAAEILLFVLTTLTGLPAPLTAVQLLWLNLVTNGIQDVALAFERGEPGRLDQKPRRPGQPIFDGLMVRQVLVSGGFIALACFVAYAWMLQAGVAHATAQNALLWLLVCFENAHCFNCRSERRSVAAIPLAANPMLVLGVLAAQGLQVAAPFVPGLNDVLGVAPLSLEGWLLLAAVAATIIPVMEAFKAMERRRS